MIRKRLTANVSGRASVAILGLFALFLATSFTVPAVGQAGDPDPDSRVVQEAARFRRTIDQMVDAQDLAGGVEEIRRMSEYMDILSQDERWEFIGYWNDPPFTEWYAQSVEKLQQDAARKIQSGETVRMPPPYNDRNRKIRTPKEGKKVTQKEVIGRDQQQTSAAFKMLAMAFGQHSVKTVSLGDFTNQGPILSTFVPVDKNLRTIAIDNETQTYYALTSHDVGTLNIESGEFNEIETSAEPISWPKGAAFVDQERRLYICSATGAGGFLYYLDVDSNTWGMSKLGRVRLEELVYNENDGLLYGLEESLGDNYLRTLRQLNRNGAVVGAIELSTPILAIRSLRPIIQMTAVDGHAYLLISDELAHSRLNRNRLYKIELSTGAVEAMPYGQKPNLVEMLWPGMPEGPSPSVDIPGVAAEGGVSNYKTPSDLIAHQKEELHVINAMRGNITTLEKMGQLLKRVKRFKVDSEGVEMTIDLESESNPSVVEVVVSASAKPIVLVVAAQERVIWDITIEEGAQLKKLILLGTEGQQVAGIPEDVDVVNHATGNPYKRMPVYCAAAWELEQNANEQFDDMIRKARDISRLREASFQGCVAGKRFQVPFNR